jgi:hypothetical protein
VVVPAIPSFVYFYRRRAMFGATARWTGLERHCPVVKGPETVIPGSSRGFTSLSFRHQVLLVVVVALLMFVPRR